MIATARVQPAEAARIFTGKHAMVKPSAGSASRLCSFAPGLVALPDQSGVTWVTYSIFGP